MLEKKSPYYHTSFACVTRVLRCKWVIWLYRFISEFCSRRHAFPQKNYTPIQVPFVLFLLRPSFLTDRLKNILKVQLLRTLPDNVFSDLFLQTFLCAAKTSQNRVFDSDSPFLTCFFKHFSAPQKLAKIGCSIVIRLFWPVSSNTSLRRKN